MLLSKKLLSGLVVALMIAGSLWFGSAPASGGSKVNGVTCVIDMLVETRGSTGAVSTVPYHHEFVLQDGEFLSDDFSTFTRFKFFDAALSKVNGEWTLALDWFADTTVFNSVDYSTVIVLSNGQKLAKQQGTHTFYTSTQSTATNFSIVVTEN